MAGGIDSSANALSAANLGANSPLNNPGSSGGLLNAQKDATEAATAPKFGEVLNKLQAQYGGKVEKPREIKKVLGKDDFLRIMITQMKHQDPTNPFKAEQMATEMAQFTSVEQMQNINENLKKMATQNQPLERLAMTNMIGKVVTVDRDRFPHTEGSKEALSYTLPQNATQVKVALVSESGEVVLEKDLGPQKAGSQDFGWDGLKSNTIPAKSGNYMFRIEAQDEKGTPMQLNSQHQSRVVGVSFEGTEPVFLVGDNRHQEKVTMKNVVRIDGDPGQASFGAPAGAGVLPAPNGAKPANFFTFEKGAGSRNLDAPDLPTTEAANKSAPPEAPRSRASGGGSPDERDERDERDAKEPDLSQAEAQARAQAQAAYAQAVKQDLNREKASEDAARSTSSGHGPDLVQSRPVVADRGFPNGLSDNK
jgi:flagellar basal-body rod modification protein FlgD